MQHPQRDNINRLKEVIRTPFAFPGGYEKALLTTDGGVICHKCAKSEYSNILHSTRGEYSDGWQVSAIFLADECDGSVICDHCSTDLKDEVA